MKVTDEQIKRLVRQFYGSKEDLRILRDYIRKHGCTDYGLDDASESFEQGWVNAFWHVFGVLGINYNKELVNVLKAREDYEFECNINEVYKDTERDEWGCASIFLNDVIGVEYNYCVDGGTNYCGIYKMEFNKKTEYFETDYDGSIHYEIDFDDEHWMENLENAMCEALIKFFEL